MGFRIVTPPLIVTPNSLEEILSRNSNIPRFQDFREMDANSNTPRFQEIGAKRREKILCVYSKKWLFNGETGISSVTPGEARPENFGH